MRQLVRGMGLPWPKKIYDKETGEPSREGNRVKIVTVCVLSFTAAGCGPVPSKLPGQETVPLGLVEDGFEQEECWCENVPEENPLFRRSFGLPGGEEEPPSPVLHIFEGRVWCRHVRNEQPSPVVEEGKRFLPRQAHCGGPDGLIRRCDDDEES